VFHFADEKRNQFAKFVKEDEMVLIKGKAQN
jgi:hypothetical protein